MHLVAFGSIADLMRTGLQNWLGGMPLHKNLPSSLEHYQNPICFFQFDYYAAINEERFAVPFGRPSHVLRHHHSRLP
jgi:hypothetical protein